MPGNLCTALRIILLSPYHLTIDLTDVTFGVSDHWLGTRTGAGGIAKLPYSFLAGP